jgi:hypothetical protein
LRCRCSHNHGWFLAAHWPLGFMRGWQIRLGFRLRGRNRHRVCRGRQLYRRGRGRRRFCLRRRRRQGGRMLPQKTPSQ